MGEPTVVKDISAEEFDKLDFDSYTLVDLREPDELIVSSIPGSLNLPLSTFAQHVDEIPRDKPVVAYCRTGDWSTQFAEILAERGYEVYNLVGGYRAWRALHEGKADAASAGAPASAKAATHPSETESAPGEPQPAKVGPQGIDPKADALFVDAKGLKCPGPIVSVGDAVRSIGDGERVYVEATEEAFESDVQVWCRQTGNPLLDLEVRDGVITALIEKGASAQAAPAQGPQVASGGHEKTMVVFSGDLDKTIAAFIMANGSAAMGRPVTMFFTFWGLNILRKPYKVRVKKDLIGKMFGAMMPRGTKKLGLSRMNMGGLGAKMIRAVMKKNGIKSLEELIQDALDHGVKIYACQMSMDIMGIKQEELLDGIVPVGVATMLGAAENSDMTYFI